MRMPEDQITAPARFEPGIYPDVPASEYHRWQLPSNSVLGHLARSPLHCRYAIDHPTAQTEEMLIGAALHTLVLEPDAYDGQFVVTGNCSAKLASGARKGEACGAAGKVLFESAWLCGTHAKGFPAPTDPRQTLAPDDSAALVGMRSAVLSNPWAAETLALPGLTELSIIFDDPITGVRCKMRADRVVQDDRRPCVVDIKTTRDASPGDFAKTIHLRGYHRQGAMYLRGCAAAGIDVGGFAIIAVEKEPPYGVAVYQLDEQALAAGEEELTRLLNLYAECEASGSWPGYSDAILPIQLPAWARPRVDAMADAI